MHVAGRLFETYKSRYRPYPFKSRSWNAWQPAAQRSPARRRVPSVFPARSTPDRSPDLGDEAGRVRNAVRRALRARRSSRRSSGLPPLRPCRSAGRTGAGDAPYTAWQPKRDRAGDAPVRLQGLDAICYIMPSFLQSCLRVPLRTSDSISRPR